MPEEPNRISWMAVRKATPVFDARGREIGRVAEVVADEQKDIFSGIGFRHGFLGSEHFVPADQIDALTERGVHLKLSAEEAERLGARPS